MDSIWDGVFLPGEMKNKLFFLALTLFTCALATSALAQSPAAARELVLQLDASQTTAAITLPTTFHTVEGTFLLKHGTVRYDPATGKTGGEVVFDATSGKTGNGSRDNKMHKEVLESQRYTEIVFKPDHTEGVLSPTGASTLKVHGQFGIHGAEHEVTIPVEVTNSGDHWSAKAAFPIPYIQWGMKNPSLLFLRVTDTVQVQFKSAGAVSP